MKKTTIFAAAAALALSTQGCGNKSAGTAEGIDTVAVGEVQDGAAGIAAATTEQISKLIESKDAAGLQSAIEGVKAKYAELVSSGKMEDAKKYAAQVQAFLKEHSEEIKAAVGENATVASLIDKVANLPMDAAEAAKAAAETAKEDAKAAVEGKVEEAKEKAGEAVDKAKEKAAEKTNEALNKAGDALKGLAK